MLPPGFTSALSPLRSWFSLAVPPPADALAVLADYGAHIVLTLYACAAGLRRSNSLTPSRALGASSPCVRTARSMRGSAWRFIA
jgi:hypothetical protein